VFVMSYCSRCGRQFGEEALFCSNCGAPLKQQTQMGQFAVPRANEIVIVLHRPSVVEKFFFFTSGILMSIPFTILAETLSVSFVSISLPELYATILSVAIIGPIIEEFAKAYPMFYRHGETERSIFSLGFLVGLGFGIVEFFLYILVYSAPILLRLPAILFHATNSSITAYGIATKKPLKFYLVAVTLHFLINFSAINFSTRFEVFWIVGVVVALLASYTLSWNLYLKTGERFVE
jgi:RsiW-degrading membrane proteinase PrsW (M82 family)